MDTRIVGLMVAMLLVPVALPQSGAHHTAPDNTQVNVGLVNCKSATETDGAFSNPAFNGIIRVTDNGVLSITAGAQAQVPNLGCRVRLSFPGTFTVHGSRPEGGLEPPSQEGVCTAQYQQPCTTTAATTGWWVTFMDAQGKATIAIQINYTATVYSVTSVAGSEVEQKIAFFTGFVEITEPSVPRLSTPLDDLHSTSSLGALKTPTPLVYAQSEPLPVSGESPIGLQNVGATMCRVNYASVGQYYHWFTGKEPGAGCTAGTASVLCCSYRLILGITEGFQGTARLRAEFSGGATNTITCTWTAPAAAGTAGAACHLDTTGLVVVGQTLVSLQGEATGRSGTNSWSLFPSFQSPA